VQESIWLIGLYERISKEDREKQTGIAEQSRSIESQELILKDFVTDYFEPGTYQIVQIFTDDGLTGTDENRPDFQRMKQFILDKKINCVVFKSLSRAFRNLADQSKFIEEFCPRNQIRFINSGEPFIDSYSRPKSAYSMEVPFHGLMNERFAQTTSMEVRKTFDMKRKNGIFIGAFAPYGYKKSPEDKGKLIIDEEAAEVVRSIFHWFVYEGLSKRGIAKKLTELGIASPSEYKKQKGLKYQNPNIKVNDGAWNPRTIAMILSNEMYIGNMVQGRQEVISYKVHDCVSVPKERWYIKENTHEAIVLYDVFKKAENLQQRDTRTTNGNKELHLFSGFLKCADCGRSLHRKVSKNIVYYFCRSYVDKGICSKHTIRLDVLEKRILMVLQEQIKLIESIADMLERIEMVEVSHKELNGLKSKLTKIEKELQQVTEAADDLYLDLKSQIITKQEYVRLKQKLQSRQKELFEVINSIKEEIQMQERDTSEEDPYYAAFLKERNITKLTRGLLVELIETVYVHDNGGLTIDFTFTDPYQKYVSMKESS